MSEKDRIYLFGMKFEKKVIMKNCHEIAGNEKKLFCIVDNDKIWQWIFNDPDSNTRNKYAEKYASR